MNWLLWEVLAEKGRSPAWLLLAPAVGAPFGVTGLALSLALGSEGYFIAGLAAGSVAGFVAVLFVPPRR